MLALERYFGTFKDKEKETSYDTTGIIQES